MHDLLPQIVFYVFAALTIMSGLMVITQNNPVRCVLFLVFAFFCSSVLWLLVQAEFLALILVLVYVGAVMTLFLFVVMMLDIDIESMKSNWRYVPLGLIVVALLVGLLISVIPADRFNTSVQMTTAIHQAVSNTYIPDTHPETVASLSNTEALGMILYTDYVYAFELAAAILLVAIIAAITLVHREPRHSKRQNITQQIMTRREDRVRLLHLKSGNK